MSLKDVFPVYHIVSTLTWKGKIVLFQNSKFELKYIGIVDESGANDEMILISFQAFSEALAKVDLQLSGVSSADSSSKRPFIMANVRELLDSYGRSEITFAKMVERMNEIAEKFYEPGLEPAQSGVVSKNAVEYNCRRNQNKITFHMKRGKLNQVEVANPDQESVLLYWGDLLDALLGINLVIENAPNEEIDTIGRT